MPPANPGMLCLPMKRGKPWWGIEGTCQEHKHHSGTSLRSVGVCDVCQSLLSEGCTLPSPIASWAGLIVSCFGTAASFLDNPIHCCRCRATVELPANTTRQCLLVPTASFLRCCMLQLPGNNSTGRHAEEYADAIAKQQNFELLVTYPAQNSNGANTSSTGLRYATATFRCAANTGLDQHMPLIGIPNFLPSTAEGGNGFYFVSINEVESQSSSRFTSASDISPTILSPKQQAARKPARLPSFSLIQKDEPFADIKLGPLLGKGAFGRVFRGTWNGKLVAVKVIEYSQEQMDDGCLLEGILSEQVQHPNVVSSTVT
eukprot:GHUV01013833.1.p1 GENE.GHUV01013833.1~~GHUV01013833.1.p1  ORF type:complete len:316 (+),score=72.02 GHUV01013833.1:1980-2927(+)